MFSKFGLSAAVTFTFAFCSLEVSGQVFHNQLLSDGTGDVGSALRRSLTSGDAISPAQATSWSLPSLFHQMNKVKLSPPTSPASSLYANISVLSHQHSLARDNGLLRRQATTPNLVTQNNMNNVAPVSTIQNAGNRPANTTGVRPTNRAIRTFTDKVQINGGFVRTQATWDDGLKIDTISAAPHILSIRKKTNPPSATFVTSADPSRVYLGGNWRALTTFSYMVTFEGESPDDLSFRMSVPYDRLQAPMNVSMDDEVYLGLFDPNRGGWVVDTERMETFRRGRRVELMGLPAPTGEYRLLARSNRDPNSSIYFSFGNGTDGQFNVLAPPTAASTAPPLQVGTWQDGTKIIIRSLQATQIRMEIRNVTTGSIPSGYEMASKLSYAPRSRNKSSESDASLSLTARYGFAITSSNPEATVIMNLQLPYVPTQLEERGFLPNALVAAGRPLRTTEPYQILTATTVSGNGALMNIPMNVVEGEYLLLAKSK
ncbi:hypothetical protein VP01_511g3 [Puccinia sorghi]|uniref:Uncharacterized protein n=1 Tax=Puccinia sorghi TaxID=27349 RepID=A0A0L6UL38_9BASI|nr:hypothetical protein VP01_511g3 [Puccinia sorghi]